MVRKHHSTTVVMERARIQELEELLRKNNIRLPASEPEPEEGHSGRPDPPPVAPGGEWREFATADDKYYCTPKGSLGGQKYYYNPDTGRTQWASPPQGTQELATMQSDPAVTSATVNQVEPTSTVRSEGVVRYRRRSRSCWLGCMNGGMCCKKQSLDSRAPLNE